MLAGGSCSTDTPRSSLPEGLYDNSSFSALSQGYSAEQKKADDRVLANVKAPTEADWLHALYKDRQYSIVFDAISSFLTNQRVDHCGNFPVC